MVVKLVASGVLFSYTTATMGTAGGTINGSE